MPCLSSRLIAYGGQGDWSITLLNTSEEYLSGLLRFPVSGVDNMQIYNHVSLGSHLKTNFLKKWYPKDPV